MNKMLSEYIEVATRFCRSINISQDFDDVELLDGYVCPASSENALCNIADNISTNGQSAFTWTGPYGSGKSSLALLFSSLLGKKKKLRDKANEKISEATRNKLNSILRIKKGWEILPVVGDTKSPESLIENCIKNRGYETTGDLLNDLTSVSKQNDGVVLFVDEMGKCLESAVKGNGDVYLFQKIAEHASRSNGKIIFIGILHQAFAEYARNLPYTVRDEWIKIQGRFVDMPINTAGEEQIDLIGKAIKVNNCCEYEKNEKLLSSLVDTISKGKKIASIQVLKDELAKCWPLNPVVVCLLSQISKKRFGQNQRSLFSFLNSGEPGAFKDFIKNTEYSKNISYMPEQFFDYLKQNLESSILASTDSKIWNISAENLQKVQTKGATKDHINVLKTISLIDLFAGTSGLNSTKNVLEAIYPNIDLDKTLQDLAKWSVIIFKKYTQSYSVYEGSDFDIEGALKEASSNIEISDLSKLSDIANFKPIIAKRHYHKFGAMRWFDVIFLSIERYKEQLEEEIQNRNSVGLFSIFLPKNADEITVTQKIMQEYQNDDYPVVFTIAKNAMFLNEYLKELLCLNWIIKNKSELNGDNVAKREIESRKSTILSLLEVQINNILKDAEWFYNTQEIGNITTNKLSCFVSDVCDKHFEKSPQILSELINRSKPSSSANSALNQLLKDMVLNQGQPDLGLTELTPEKSLYKILLQDTGLYKQIDKNWGFYSPEKANLQHLWKATDELLNKSPKAISMAEIYDMWSKPPFGIKKGLINLLGIAYIISHSHDYAVYKDGMFVPEFTDILEDYLLKQPKVISLKEVHTGKNAEELLKFYITILNELYPKPVKLRETATALQVAQRFALLSDKLHPWVLKTKTLSKITTKLREILKTASDPEQLLFVDFKNIFFDSEKSESELKQISEGLEKSLMELLECYPNMLHNFGILVMNELDVPLPTSEKIKELQERAKNIIGTSGNQSVNAFISRISTFEQKFDDIAGLIGLANGISDKEWIDLNIENAKNEIIPLCIGFKKAELTAKVKNRTSNRQGIAFITGVGGETKTFDGDFDILNSARPEIDALKNKLSKVANTIKDRNILLSALTELMIENLKDKK